MRDALKRQYFVDIVQLWRNYEYCAIDRVRSLKYSVPKTKREKQSIYQNGERAEVLWSEFSSYTKTFN